MKSFWYATAALLMTASVALGNISIYLLTHPSISDRWGNICSADTIVAFIVGGVCFMVGSETK